MRARNWEKSTIHVSHNSRRKGQTRGTSDKNTTQREGLSRQMKGQREHTKNTLGRERRRKRGGEGKQKGEKGRRGRGEGRERERERNTAAQHKNGGLKSH